MNKEEIVREFKGIFSLIKMLASDYSKNNVTIRVADFNQSNMNTDKFEQHIDFLAGVGVIDTKQREGDRFTLGINLNMMVFLGNYYDDIEYILNEKEDTENYWNFCLTKINHIFKAVDTRHHCSRCCDYYDEGVE